MIMAVTITPDPSKPDPSNPDPKKAIDKDTAELSTKGKVLAGILLVLPCVLAIVLLLGYWPDRLPGPDEHYKPLYIRELFHTRLACIPSSFCCVDSFFAWKEARAHADSLKCDSLRAHSRDSAKIDTTKIDTAKAPKPDTGSHHCPTQATLPPTKPIT